MEILFQRVPKPGLVDSDFWTTAEVQDSFDEADKIVVEKYLADINQPDTDGYSDAVWKFAKKVRAAKAAAAAAGKGKARGRGRQQGGAQPRAKQAKHVHTPAIACGITEEEARPLVAPGARLYKYNAENRWICTMPPYGTCSRSWTVYGETVSLLKVCAWTWHCEKKSGGDDCPYPEVAETDWRAGR